MFIFFSGNLISFKTIYFRFFFCGFLFFLSISLLSSSISVYPFALVLNSLLSFSSVLFPIRSAFISPSASQLPSLLPLFLCLPILVLHLPPLFPLPSLHFLPSSLSPLPLLFPIPLPSHSPFHSLSSSSLIPLPSSFSFRDCLPSFSYSFSPSYPFSSSPSSVPTLYLPPLVLHFHLLTLFVPLPPSFPFPLPIASLVFLSLIISPPPPPFLSLIISLPLLPPLSAPSPNPVVILQTDVTFTHKRKTPG